MKIVVLAVILSSSSLAYSLSSMEDHFRNCGGFLQEGFVLQIRGSILGEDEIKLCSKDSFSYLIVYRSDFKQKKGSDTVMTSTVRKINLSEDQLSEINKLLITASDYDTLDSFGPGPDSPFWCLKTKYKGLVRQGCFWDPNHRSSERGLKGLVNFASYLKYIIYPDGDKLGWR